MGIDLRWLQEILEPHPKSAKVNKAKNEFTRLSLKKGSYYRII